MNSPDNEKLKTTFLGRPLTCCCVVNSVIGIFTVFMLLASAIIASVYLSTYKRDEVLVLPSKFSPPYYQPHTTQGDRGTCWFDFAENIFFY